MMGRGEEEAVVQSACTSHDGGGWSMPPLEARERGGYRTFLPCSLNQYPTSSASSSSSSSSHHSRHELNIQLLPPLDCYPFAIILVSSLFCSIVFALLCSLLPYSGSAKLAPPAALHLSHPLPSYRHSYQLVAVSISRAALQNLRHSCRLLFDFLFYLFQFPIQSPILPLLLCEPSIPPACSICCPASSSRTSRAYIHPVQATASLPCSHPATPRHFDPAPPPEVRLVFWSRCPGESRYLTYSITPVAKYGG
ncbi:hypothetical protein BKA56DRAFT_156987 [Ilyonectria sp. MPI-CAGE-AT-0026]|nr:hypothetical protein BKA56DRAFT_156987 [Ilyonectria sp. MPI-CAGE-AT-0026]